MAEYIKLKSALHILDLVMSDENIKHKGKAVRKRLKELPTVEVRKGDLLKRAKELQGDAFAGPLIVAEIEKEGVPDA
jgi:hypothetical protein